MAGGTGTFSFDSYARELCMGTMLCMDSSECVIEKLDKCKLFPFRESCLTYLLAKEIKENTPQVYEEWKKAVEKQESDIKRHGINAVIVYGLAKIYSLRKCIIIPALGDDLIKNIKEMRISELMADLESLFDYDLRSSVFGMDEDNQLAVLKIFKMFYDGTKQPVIL